MKIPLVARLGSTETQIGWVDIKDDAANELAIKLTKGFGFRVHGIVELSHNTHALKQISFCPTAATPEPSKYLVIMDDPMPTNPVTTIPAGRIVQWPQYGNDTPAVGRVCILDDGTGIEVQRENGLFTEVAHWPEITRRQLVLTCELKPYLGDKAS